ncbi:uncharacterized protein LOC103989493 [Musa acuminata AAA Group]|uniref:uncharacterized protein LOC103989493 n=1 Tax=Musa acuminata AAA Group TaxID=214697 RepID=UPI0031CDB6EC
MEASSITDREEWTLVDRKDTSSGVDAAADSGSGIPFSRISVWTRWALGSVIGFAVPLCRRILRTEDAVAKAAESGAEAVEKIAKSTEKIASEIADELPDGVSLKEKALQIEQICEEVDRDAERAEIFIHKVDHIKAEVDAIIEPIIEKGEEIEKEIQEQEGKGQPISQKQ